MVLIQLLFFISQDFAEPDLGINPKHAYKLSMIILEISDFGKITEKFRLFLRLLYGK